MATATDNDLLILSDEDTKADDLGIEETSLNEDVSAPTEEIISFDDMDSETKTEEVKDESSNTLDFGADDLNITEESTPELNIIEESKEDTTPEAGFDFGDLGTEVNSEADTKEAKEETNEDSMFVNDLSIDSSSTVGTMEDILDKAITDLDTRAEAISTEKVTKEENIADLKAQIEDLEIRVKTANDEVAELDSEQAMITKNTKSLERMKNTNVASNVKSETSRKVHNTKRKQAA